jgi:hypothetical protein
MRLLSSDIRKHSWYLLPCFVVFSLRGLNRLAVVLVEEAEQLA